MRLVLFLNGFFLSNNKFPVFCGLEIEVLFLANRERIFMKLFYYAGYQVVRLNKSRINRSKHVLLTTISQWKFTLYLVSIVNLEDLLER